MKCSFRHYIGVTYIAAVLTTQVKAKKVQTWIHLCSMAHSNHEVYMLSVRGAAAKTLFLPFIYSSKNKSMLNTSLSASI